MARKTEASLLLLFTLGLVTVLILSLIGLGYMTEMVLSNKELKDYQRWQIDFMRIFVIFSWIALAYQLFAIGYKLKIKT
jgi:hypothetical protein